MYETLNRYNHGAFQVVGFLDDDSTKADKIIGTCTILGTSQTLVQMAKKNAIDVAVIAITKVKQPDLMRALLEVKSAGVEIYDMPAFYEELTGKLPVDHLRDGWVAYTRFQGMQRRAYTIRIKRLTDIVLSIVGLIVSLPLCIATALAIKVDSKGPILFKQTRIGLNRRPFDLIKFRTMTVGREHDRQFAGQMDDPRITRVGRIIRKLRIDELPQMWSVLKGDMSFIGPRALIEEEVNEFEQKIPYFSLRHSIPPGITGWAQVNYRHGATLKDGLEKLKYDLFYLKNLSPLLDLHILLKTAWVVLFPQRRQVNCSRVCKECAEICRRFCRSSFSSDRIAMEKSTIGTFMVFDFRALICYIFLAFCHPRFPVRR